MVQYTANSDYSEHLLDCICCQQFNNITIIIQGSYGFLKMCKVLEFYWGIFQAWKVLEKGPLVLESPGNLLNSTKKYEVYGRQ